MSSGRGEAQRGKAGSGTHKHLGVLEVRATYSSVTLHARCRDKVVTAAGREGWRERGAGTREDASDEEGKEEREHGKRRMWMGVTEGSREGRKE